MYFYDSNVDTNLGKVNEMADCVKKFHRKYKKFYRGVEGRTL